MAGEQRWTVGRVIDGIMFILFALSVIVQFNDPDPALWVVIYSLAALVALLSMRARLAWPFAALVTTIAVIWASRLAPRVIGKVPFLDMFNEFEMQNVGIEESREMYGLLMIGVYTGVAAWRAVRGRE